ncbi:unnamed protein product [Didymodactylos carnosus]|uniref:Major facilitator superfamily (MFS) profile domain-containing protein n=1 Tax=Didymodactylos carnosus TaxID=1234261 RepID=A0A8S2HDD0_9BILA|nr:unnamed protein product [Didymodactylos carnosus]CAF3625161.1 unnamed protein product [Didymodactylos carnosus]
MDGIELSQQPEQVKLLIESPLTIGETTTTKKSTLFPYGYLTPFFLVTFLVFLWGIPSQLNGILIRQFSKSFILTQFEAGLVQSAFYMGYFLLAIPAGFLMQKFGYKFGFLSGLGLFSLGCFLFWPAALINRYSIFLLSLFIIASGLSFLETAANPFIAQLGDPETSEQRLNFSQAFNPLGAMTGVLIGIELDEHEIHQRKLNGTYERYLKQETLRVIHPYLVLSGISLLWAIFTFFIKFPTTATKQGVVTTIADDQNNTDNKKLCRPYFFLAVLAQFMYVGAQVCTWSYFIQYAQEYTQMKEKSAGYWLTGTLVMFGLGRFSSAYLMQHWIKAQLLMGIYGIINIVLVLVAILIRGWVGFSCLFCTSFFMSLMFPTIFALGLKDLTEKKAKLAGSLLVMAIVGGAVLTPLMGLISELMKTIAIAYFVPLFAYGFVVLFAFIDFLKIN